MGRCSSASTRRLGELQGRGRRPAGRRLRSCSSAVSRRRRLHNARGFPVPPFPHCSPSYGPRQALARRSHGRCELHGPLFALPLHSNLSSSTRRYVRALLVVELAMLGQNTAARGGVCPQLQGENTRWMPIRPDQGLWCHVLHRI